MTTAAIPSIFDTQSLAAIKTGLSKNDPQALKAATRQFEAVFLQMVLKSMRAATPQDGMFNSDQTRFYSELLDSQMAQVMAAKGGTGLAAMLERQMTRDQAAPLPVHPDGLPLAPELPALPLSPSQRKYILDQGLESKFLPLDHNAVRVPARNPSMLPAAVPPASTFRPMTTSESSPADTFVSTMGPEAVSASRQTGIPAQYLLAHAALETGWGKSEPRFADGRPSHNLFGIKAGSSWNGAVVEAVTTEYVNGRPVSRVERFRAYGSYSESFNDYARLLTTQPRYAQVLGAQDPASFARGLQNAGYATDPDYANKLVRVIESPALGMRG